MSKLDNDFHDLVFGNTILSKKRQADLVEAMIRLRHERRKESATKESLLAAIDEILEEIDG